MYFVIIVEDDWIHAQLIEAWLRQFSHEFQVIEIFETCAAAYIALNNGQRCDLLLLDMELEDMNGMRFFESLSVRPYTIIQTLHTDFAIEAYRLAVNDYLVKPFEQARFQQAILRFLGQMKLMGTPINQSLAADFLLVKSGHDTLRIAISDILYLRSERHYLHIIQHTQETTTLQTAAQLLSRMAGVPFVQVHRSYYIHFAHFTRMTNDCIFLGAHEVPLGTSYRKDFEAFLAAQGG